jgi:hypothetical protein
VNGLNVPVDRGRQKVAFRRINSGDLLGLQKVASMGFEKRVPCEGLVMSLGNTILV